MEEQQQHTVATETSTMLQRQRRSVCESCSRPLPVCLCHAMPPNPISTATRIIIVQHPHESRHKLNTIPLITRSLVNVTSLVCRKLRPGLHPILDSLHSNNNNNNQLLRAIYLFPPSPSSPAVTLSELKNVHDEDRGEGDLVLIVFDATWKHAREMVRASESYLDRFALRVCLDGAVDETARGGSVHDSDDSGLLLRKEPCGGCVTTAEAVARCLGVVEPNGPDMESKLIELLREMVRLQATFLKPMKPRPRLLKKNTKV